MMIKMAIADTNEEYLQRLLNVFEENEELNLSIYTDKYALENALISKKFDIILFDASFYDGQAALSRSGQAILLMDESIGVPEECRDLPKINKYQRISKIYQQILDYYSRICADNGIVLGQGSVNMVAFYSPVGGCGKTTMSLVAAAKLAMQGHRTFYLNLEGVSSQECYLPQTEEKGIEELLISLGSDMNYRYKIESLLQQKAENFFYMNHFDSPNDMNEMTEAELSELIGQLAKSGLFDDIIIDLGTEINSKLMTVFEEVNKVILVEKPDTISALKMNCFLSQTHIMAEYGKKMVRLLNFDNGRGSQVQTELKNIGRIGVAQNMDCGQLINMMVNSGGVNFISELM